MTHGLIRGHGPGVGDHCCKEHTLSLAWLTRRGQQVYLHNTLSNTMPYWKLYRHVTEWMYYMYFLFFDTGCQIFCCSPLQQKQKCKQLIQCESKRWEAHQRTEIRPLQPHFPVTPFVQAQPIFQNRSSLVLQLDNLLLARLIHTPFLSPSLAPGRKETETRGFASR